MHFIIEELEKLPNESVKDYEIRCFNLREKYKLSWKELALIINNNTNRYFDEGYYRKKASRYRKKSLVNNDNIIPSDDLKDLLLEIKKERVKLSEERTQNNAYIRKLSREETLKEIADNFADKMSVKKLLIQQKNNTFIKDDNAEAIVMLSDWHYGLEINNYFNVYNPEICKKRVSKLLQEVINIGTQHKITKLHVVNLSDLIAGRIHLSIRLQSREDVISQVMTVSEILAEFLLELSNYFNIVYTDVMDNHSRLEPNAKDSIELETLVRIIPWYLQQRLQHVQNIEYVYNTYADDIAAFKIFDFNVVAVHGHKDKLNKIIENLSAMTRRRNDLVLSAHYHHLSLDESHECMRISNGSLMGVDSYAQDLRLTNKPSQTMIICTPDNITKAIYKINLN